MYHNSATPVISTIPTTTGGFTTGNLEGTTGNISSNNGSVATTASTMGLRHQSHDAISPAVVSAAAAANPDDSESDYEQFTGNRSRQKKFLKNFKQLPQEEVVLQRKYKIFCFRNILRLHNYFSVT